VQETLAAPERRRILGIRPGTRIHVPDNGEVAPDAEGIAFLNDGQRRYVEGILKFRTEKVAAPVEAVGTVAVHLTPAELAGLEDARRATAHAMASRMLHDENAANYEGINVDAVLAASRKANDEARLSREMVAHGAPVTVDTGATVETGSPAGEAEVMAAQRSAQAAIAQTIRQSQVPEKHA
jgi:hypothetical protein